MVKEYKVTVDQSLFASNDPGAIEKKMRELGGAGWNLMHVTSVTAGGSDITNTSRIYLFWEREAAERPVQPSEGQSFGGILKKLLSGTEDKTVPK